MIRNNLIKTVKLPYKEVRGSFETRQNKAEQFTHKVINNLSGQFCSHDMSLSKFGRELKKVLPKNLNFYVCKNKDKGTYAQLSSVYSDNNNIIGNILEINPNEKGKITILQIPTIAHEIRHLGDYLYHPKMLAREQTITKKGLDTNKFIDFYDKDIYVQEMDGGKKLKSAIVKNIRQHTKKALKGHSLEEKIDMLQWIRYNLISERNAYKEGAKVGKKLNKKNIPVYEDAIHDSSKDYMFDEKIKLFHDMIAEIIKEERGRHKANIKNYA